MDRLKTLSILEKKINCLGRGCQSIAKLFVGYLVVVRMNSPDVAQLIEGELRNLMEKTKQELMEEVSDSDAHFMAIYGEFEKYALEALEDEKNKERKNTDDDEEDASKKRKAEENLESEKIKTIKILVV